MAFGNITSVTFAEQPKADTVHMSDTVRISQRHFSTQIGRGSLINPLEMEDFDEMKNSIQLPFHNILTTIDNEETFLLRILKRPLNNYCKTLEKCFRCNKLSVMLSSGTNFQSHRLIKVVVLIIFSDTIICSMVQ